MTKGAWKGGKERHIRYFSSRNAKYKPNHTHTKISFSVYTALVHLCFVSTMAWCGVWFFQFNFFLFSYHIMMMFYEMGSAVPRACIIVWRAAKRAITTYPARSRNHQFKGFDIWAWCGFVRCSVWWARWGRMRHPPIERIWKGFVWIWKYA